MDFRFSGNNGNIVGKAHDTRYSGLPFLMLDVIALSDTI